MKTTSYIAIALALGTVVCAPSPGAAAVFCKRRNGVIVLRDACRRRESQVQFSTVTGAQGLKGDIGPKGDPGDQGAAGQDGSPGFNDVQVVDCPQFTNTINQTLGATATGGTILASCLLPPGTWLFLGRVTLENADPVDLDRVATATCQLKGPTVNNVIETQVVGLTAPSGLGRNNSLTLFGSAVVGPGAGGTQIACGYDGNSTKVTAANANVIAIKVQQVVTPAP